MRKLVERYAWADEDYELAWTLYFRPTTLTRQVLSES
jgi:hypothetical protein